MSAERHGVWIALSKQGRLKRISPKRYGVAQQAGSESMPKYVRNVPASEAELLRLTRAAQITSMYKMANQACERAQSDKVLLNFIGMALGLMEREARLSGPRRSNAEAH